MCLEFYLENMVTVNIGQLLSKIFLIGNFKKKKNKKLQNKLFPGLDPNVKGKYNFKGAGEMP